MDNSLRALNVSYIDLYLIHWPGASRVHGNSESNSKLRADSWKTLIELKKENKLRSIGVSNFTIKHLEELKSFQTKPDVNQVYFNFIVGNVIFN